MQTFDCMKREKKKKLVSVAQYSSLCGGDGISKNAIYKRIRIGEISSEMIYVGGYPTTVIDIHKYPPEPAKPRGRKKYSVDL